jgi:putative ABC transport system permease protein
MRKLRVLWGRLRGAVGATPADDEFAAELESHLQMHTDDNLRSGMTPEQARRNAILKLGGLEQTKQAYRERNTIPFIEALLSDVRYALRQLIRSPGFTMTAILLITIGIGANAAIFTLVDFVLVRPLPFPEPERLVKVWEKHPGYPMMELSPANYSDLKAANTSFAALAAYSGNSMNLVGRGEPQRIDGAQVTGNLFSTLGRPALIGRYFSEDDDKAGAPGKVVLSYALWQTEFAGDGNVLGKSIFLDNGPYTVIGIMPPDFLFPSRETQFWTTFKFQEGDYQDRDNNYLAGIGRLKPRVSLAKARSELMLIAARLQRQYPKENQGVDVSVIALRDELSTQSRFLLKVLCGAALSMLVIACANLANLLLTRSLARQKELSIRLSLGANRRHILRQFLSESLLLGFAGGASAVGVATAALPLLSRLVPNSLPTQQVPPVDLRMLLFALSLTLTIVILFGVAPALWACRTAGFGGLRVGVRTGGAGHHRLRSVLVMAEVAVSVLLLISSGLLIRALWKVQSTDPGFRTNNILTLHTELPFPKYDETSVRAQFYGKVLADVRRLPGVTSAAYITALPMEWRGGIWPVAVGGRDQILTEGNGASARFVTPGFFSTLGIPIQSGRDFSETDTADRPYVAVVSESFVRRYWPNEQPIGQHFGFDLHDREIIGVVRDIRVRGLERTSEPQVYLGYKQVPDGMLAWYAPKDLVIHSSQAPQSLLPAIRQIIRTADADQPVSNVRTMEEIVGGETESRAIQMRVLIAFTAVAILLAGLGIYGLLSFAVSMRQQEFGIRMALGAGQGDIFKMVLGQGAVLAVAGLLPGLALAYMAARLLESLLAGVRPADALTFSTAIALCLITTLLGSLVPALRAVRADPTAVMRAE